MPWLCNWNRLMSVHFKLPIFPATNVSQQAQTDDLFFSWSTAVIMDWANQKQKEQTFLFPCTVLTLQCFSACLQLWRKRLSQRSLLAFVLMFTVKTRVTCSRFLAFQLTSYFLPANNFWESWCGHCNLSPGEYYPISLRSSDQSHVMAASHPPLFS